MLLKNLWWGKQSLRGGVAAAAVSGVLMLVACGGDSGTSASNNDGTSDSEEIQSSSSSQKHSSSSQKSSSSSNLKTVSSSSNQSSSSSEENDDGWSWDKPKDAYLNPEIDYGSMTDSRDGQIYKTVKIGDQVWMAENLNFDPGQGGSDDPKYGWFWSKYDWSWCYNNEPKNCAVAGRLYTWAAAIDSVKLAIDVENPQDCGYGEECTLPDTVQGICPDGWHLPTQAEWNTLFAEVGGQLTAGNILKSQTGWNNKGNGSDGVGFSALPAGNRYYCDGSFDCDGDFAIFWSAAEFDSGRAYFMLLRELYENSSSGKGYKYYGLSVRCLKN